MPGSHFKPINSESPGEEPEYWNFFETPLGDLDSECLRTVCLSRGLIFRGYQMSAEMGLRSQQRLGHGEGMVNSSMETCHHLLKWEVLKDLNEVLAPMGVHV